MAGALGSGPGRAQSSWALASPQRKLCPETAEATGTEGRAGDPVARLDGAPGAAPRGLGWTPGSRYRPRSPCSPASKSRSRPGAGARGGRGPHLVSRACRAGCSRPALAAPPLHRAQQRRKALPDKRSADPVWG